MAIQAPHPASSPHLSHRSSLPLWTDCCHLRRWKLKGNQHRIKHKLKMLWANITTSGLSASRPKLSLTWEPSVHDTGRTNCFWGTDAVEKYLFPWSARMSWDRIILFQCQSPMLLLNDSQIAEAAPVEFLSKPVLHEKSLFTKTNFRAWNFLLFQLQYFSIWNSLTVELGLPLITR